MFFRCDLRSRLQSIFFFFNDTATTEIYTLSLHDALPIFRRDGRERFGVGLGGGPLAIAQGLEQRTGGGESIRSEEHTSELQSQSNLVCRLLLEKKKYKPSSGMSDAV